MLRHFYYYTEYWLTVLLWTLVCVCSGRYVRALHYRYKFTKLGSEEAGRGQWWSRELIGQPYMPIVSAAQLRPTIEAQGWHWYSPEHG